MATKGPEFYDLTSILKNALEIKNKLHILAWKQSHYFVA